MTLSFHLNRVAATAVLSLLAFGAFMSDAALAAAPQQRNQAPGFYRLILGDFEITALSDGTADFPMDKILIGAKPGEVEAAFGQAFLKLPVETSVNTFLINTRTKLVLVDAGAGDLFGPTLGHTVENLRAAGYRPEEVDAVLITHFHGDHIGGLEHEGKLVFPNATVYVNEKDRSYWLNESNEANAPDDAKPSFKMARLALSPALGAGKVKPFSGDTVIFPGIKAIEAPGHTAGHTIYQIESEGQKLLLWGDLMHAAAVQFPDPEVAVQWDSDPKQAVATREKILADAAKNGYWIAGAHLPFPAFGHIRADGKGYVYVPINYTMNRPPKN
ncbi:MBL fold metallo-hydrolase [Hypericibacter adhaerens]|uniref:MBL fold metallo-hydrolase n=1 Tax=Hypericibacter adhaerens TaxID=2602016 RepID=A0A5J6N6Q5_9PROT|nr:MBL fold metallo-hydrolase [Hypericibacter adhaerens]QEX22616.1 MBL fold metallo-hydrolase [Hypericibacter adhaerens]